MSHPLFSENIEKTLKNRDEKIEKYRQTNVNSKNGIFKFLRTLDSGKRRMRTPPTEEPFSKMLRWRQSLT